jgi:putative ABC transport system permease protein
MAEDQTVVGFYDGTSDQTRADARALLAELRGAFPSATVVPIRDAIWQDTGHLPFLAGPIQRPSQDPDVQGGTAAASLPVRTIGTLVVGGADTLRALHAEDGIAALRAGTVVAVGPDATDHGAIHLARKGPIPVDLPSGTITLPATDAGHTRYASVVDQYTYVISPRAAAAAGLSSKPTETFVARLPPELTAADRDRIATIVERHPGATFEDLSNLGSQNGPGRWAFGIAGTTLALLIVAVVVALIGEESRRDRAIVTAVGASPRTRRALAGASACVVAAAAGALAVPAGLIPVVVFRIAQDRGYPIVVPWAPIAIALLGVPLIAGLAAAVASRRPSALALLRPIA